MYASETRYQSNARTTHLERLVDRHRHEHNKMGCYQDIVIDLCLYFILGATPGRGEETTPRNGTRLSCSILGSSWWSRKNHSQTCIQVEGRLSGWSKAAAYR